MLSHHKLCCNLMIWLKGYFLKELFRICMHTSVWSSKTIWWPWGFHQRLHKAVTMTQGAACCWMETSQIIFRSLFQTDQTEEGRKEPKRILVFYTTPLKVHLIFNSVWAWQEIFLFLANLHASYPCQVWPLPADKTPDRTGKVLKSIFTLDLYT